MSGCKDVRMNPPDNIHISLVAKVPESHVQHPQLGVGSAAEEGLSLKQCNSLQTIRYDYQKSEIFLQLSIFVCYLLNSSRLIKQFCLFSFHLQQHHHLDFIDHLLLSPLRRNAAKELVEFQISEKIKQFEFLHKISIMFCCSENNDEHQGVVILMSM